MGILADNIRKEAQAIKFTDLVLLRQQTKASLAMLESAQALSRSITGLWLDDKASDQLDESSQNYVESVESWHDVLIAEFERKTELYTYRRDDKHNPVKPISELDFDLVLIQNESEVEQTLLDCGVIPEAYNEGNVGIFVRTGDAEILEVWLFEGIVAYGHKSATRVYLADYWHTLIYIENTIPDVMQSYADSHTFTESCPKYVSASDVYDSIAQHDKNRIELESINPGQESILQALIDLGYATRNPHYIAMAGLRGYMPNYTASYTDNDLSDVVDSLIDMHEPFGEEIEALTEEQYKAMIEAIRAELTANLYVSFDRTIDLPDGEYISIPWHCFGNECASIDECYCDNPEEHDSD